MVEFQNVLNFSKTYLYFFFLNLNSNNESKNILLTLNFITIITITPKTSINIDQKGLFYTKTK